MTINECIVRYEGETDLNTLFIATQCTVNTSEYDNKGLGKLYMPINEVVVTDNGMILIDNYEHHSEFTSFLPKDFSKRKDIFNIMYPSE